MKRRAATCLLGLTLLLSGLFLIGCGTDYWGCVCQRTCDGQVRTGLFDVCSDQDDLTLAIAYATQRCEALLAPECVTYSCGCSCYEGWANCY